MGDGLVPDPVFRSSGYDRKRIAALESQVRILQARSAQTERLEKLGSWEFDFDTQSLTWSDGTYHIFGIKPGSPITLRRALAFFSVDRQAEIASYAEQAKLTGSGAALLLSFTSAQGRHRWIRLLCTVETIAETQRLVGVVQDVTDQRETDEQLRQLAYQDSTTGLPNRRRFQVQLAAASVATGPAASFALLLIGLDGFKTLNDVHGHLVGDRLLQSVARRLQAAVRPDDMVARLAGDEFAVILYDILTAEQAEHCAALLLGIIRDNINEEIGTVIATISIGIALQQPGTTGPDELLTRADIALSRAKALGRDQFCLFLPEYRTELETRYYLLADVRRALKQGEFEVFYQPIVDLQSYAVRGLEALIRWRHPARGLLAPAAFQTALQDAGTSVAIDEFVLTESLRQMRSWLDAGVSLADTGMNVNVSAAQLKRPDLIPFITATLRRFELAPEQLKLEVLETAFQGSETKTVAIAIQALADLGIVSALDDFGTGYASLTHLKQLKIERIKIDHSFVSTLCSNDYDRTIVKSIIGLGRNLGIPVTAEGVETLEQLQLLRDLECDCGQGYLFARPLHPSEVPQAIADWYDGEAMRRFGLAETLLEPSCLA